MLREQVCLYAVSIGRGQGNAFLEIEMNTWKSENSIMKIFHVFIQQFSLQLQAHIENSKFQLNIINDHEY